MGIVNAGTAAGAVLAPPAIAAIILGLNWHWVFFLSGATGLLWTVWWLAAYREPALSQHADETGQPLPWSSLLTFRQVWGLVCAKFLSDAAWYFYLFWLPKYLYDVRGFDTRHVGYFAWSVRGFGSGEPVGRLVYGPIDWPRALARFFAQGRDGGKRGRDADRLFREIGRAHV